MYQCVGGTYCLYVQADRIGLGNHSYNRWKERIGLSQANGSWFHGLFLRSLTAISSEQLINKNKFKI